MGEDVETYWDGETWRNRLVGRRTLPGGHACARAAMEVGRAEARARGVAHVVRREDGSVADRRRYPRRSTELPG